MSPGEELCIFYGSKLSFTPAEQSSNCSTHIAASEAQVDGDDWGRSSVVEPVNDNLFVNPYLEGDPDEIIPEEDLPFTRLKLSPEEEDVESIRTSKQLTQPSRHHYSPRLAQAWAVDIPDQRHITTMLKYVPAPFSLPWTIYTFLIKMAKTGRS